MALTLCLTDEPRTLSLALTAQHMGRGCGAGLPVGRSPVKVKGTHGPVHGRGHNDVASGGEGHAGDPT